MLRSVLAWRAWVRFLATMFFIQRKVESRILRRMNIRFETKAAGGRKSKACNEMETKDEKARPEEAQIYIYLLIR